VNGLGLRGAGVIGLVPLVNDHESEVAAVAAEDALRERHPARPRHGLVEGLAAGWILAPGAAGVQLLQEAAQAAQRTCLSLPGRRRLQSLERETVGGGMVREVALEGGPEVAQAPEREGPGRLVRPGAPQGGAGGEARDQGILGQDRGEQGGEGLREPGREVGGTPADGGAAQAPGGIGARGGLEVRAAAGAAALDALPGVAELGGLAGEEVDVGGLPEDIEIGERVEDLNAGAGQDGRDLVGPALDQVWWLCGALVYAELWPAQPWHQAAPDRHCT
jgi:hypothetical protein